MGELGEWLEDSPPYWRTTPTAELEQFAREVSLLLHQGAISPDAAEACILPIRAEIDRRRLQEPPHNGNPEGNGSGRVALPAAPTDRPAPILLAAAVRRMANLLAGARAGELLDTVAVVVAAEIENGGFVSELWQESGPKILRIVYDWSALHRLMPPSLRPELPYLAIEGGARPHRRRP